jgi:hypothetical protein
MEDERRSYSRMDWLFILSLGLLGLLGILVVRVKNSLTHSRALDSRESLIRKRYAEARTELERRQREHANH